MMNQFPTMFNINLHDQCVDALLRSVTEEIEDLANHRTGDFGDYRYRIGRVAGLHDAIAILHETREKLQES